MEKYRDQLKKRMAALVIFNCTFMLLGIVLCSLIDKSANGFGYSFLHGVLVGLQALCIFFIVRSGVLLKNEAELKKAYIASIDERKKAINAKALSTSALIIHFTLALALIVACVLDKTAALILLGALLFSCAVILITKFIYSKIM